MIITLRVLLPMTEAQGVKESIAMRLEDMGGAVKVVSVEDDGYGKQISMWGVESLEEEYPESMAMLRKLRARKGGGT